MSKLSDALHSAGLSGLQVPQTRDAALWNKYRETLADRLESYYRVRIMQTCFEVATERADAHVMALPTTVGLEFALAAAFVAGCADAAGKPVAVRDAYDAKSWHAVGDHVKLPAAETVDDIVIIDDNPIGFYAGQDDKFVYVLGSDCRGVIMTDRFLKKRVTAVRRLTY